MTCPAGRLHTKTALMNILFLFLYRFIVAPLATCLILFATLIHKKIRAGIKMRFAQANRPPYPKWSKKCRPIWIHCSSGEFEYAKPLLRKIKENNPQEKILVTYFSPSHEAQIKKHPLVDLAYPLPWDTSGSVTGFIKQFQPKALLFARCDLWPELLEQCKSRKVPTFLFSRTQPQSLKKYPWHFFNSMTFGKLDHISFVTSADKSNYNVKYPEQKTHVHGDTRYDEVFNRNSQASQLKPIETKSFTLVLGSVWSEDLNALAASLKKLTSSEDISLIIAPHEFNDNIFRQIEDICSDAKITYYSKIESWNGQGVLIIDEYGLLFDTYRLANLSFVGGSFKSRVHSVMEPLSCGSPVALGPRHLNNREAIEYKSVTAPEQASGSSLKLVQLIPPELGLYDLVKKWKLSSSSTQKVRQGIQKKVKEKTGATERVFNLLGPYL